MGWVCCHATPQARWHDLQSTWVPGHAPAAATVAAAATLAAAAVALAAVPLTAAAAAPAAHPAARSAGSAGRGLPPSALHPWGARDVHSTPAARSRLSLCKGMRWPQRAPTFAVGVRLLKVIVGLLQLVVVRGVRVVALVLALRARKGSFEIIL